MDRRAFLGAALGAAVACTRRAAPRPLPTATPAPTPTVDPDVALLTSWWLSERRLLASLPAAAAPLRAAHATRADAVAEHLAARGATPPAAPTAAPSRDAARTMEDASARYLADLARAASADVAVLGAELAAGARQHAVVLTLAARR